jgi:AsmA-like C-terminal region
MRESGPETGKLRLQAQKKSKASDSMLQNLAIHSVKLGKTAFLVLGAVALALGIAGVVLALHWPFSQDRVTQSLQESFPATVTFQKFHSTYFPHPGCVGDGLVFRRLGSSPSTPPIVTIQRITFEGHYIDILLRPGYLSRVVMNGFRVQVPRVGTPLEKSTWKETPSSTRVDEIVADGAVLEIARADPHTPLLFDIHTLKLGSVRHDKAMSYAVSLHNPLPPGEISSHGQFGPWNSSDPGQTPVAGQYTFQNADLGVFDGIAGMLSSEDKFQGPLQHIEAQGSIDIPDFMVARSEHSVHVTSDFHAFVDGTNGDVDLERVNAAFLKTRVVANGKIAGQSGQHGKTTSVDLTVREGRIQDVLRLFVRRPKPPLNGITSFRAHVVIPPEDRTFLRKVRLTGDFGIAGGEFTKPSVQADVDHLSEKARGAKLADKPEDEDPDRVISGLAGHVELRNATAALTDLSFVVPGAAAQMHGTYNLESEAVNLHGTLKTDAEFSKMTGGFKSVLLKPLDVFFKRKHAGAAVPVHLLGTYAAPQIGLDLPVPGQKGPAQPSSAATP